MAKLTRLLGLAAKALEKHASSQRDSHPQPAGSARRDPGPQRGGYAPPASRASGHNAYAPPPAHGAHGAHGSAGTVSDADRAAIARYDYLTQTADPHRVEQMHREAFARLTPAQRAEVQARMQAELAPGERPASSSPDDLARAAGRTEAARPGRMRSLLSRVRGRGAAGLAGGAAVGVLGAVAGGAVMSAVAAPLLEQAAGLGVDFESLAQGIDVESLMQGVDLEGLAGGIDTEGISGAADGLLGSAGETVSGFGETASGWGERLGDLGLPGIRDLFSK